MAYIVYLALGTNQGDRQRNLSRAIDILGPRVRVTGISPVYETPPWGVLDQPRFYNIVLKAETDLTPEQLLMHLKWIERNLGRVKTVRYGPRVIDLDILFYDELVFESPGLTIPHLRLHERAFVLVPLADIAPDLNHPVFGKTVRELLQEVDTSGIEKVEESANPRE